MTEVIVEKTLQKNKNLEKNIMLFKSMNNIFMKTQPVEILKKMTNTKYLVNSSNFISAVNKLNSKKNGKIIQNGNENYELIGQKIIAAYYLSKNSNIEDPLISSAKQVVEYLNHLTYFDVVNDTIINAINIYLRYYDERHIPLNIIEELKKKFTDEVETKKLNMMKKKDGLENDIKIKKIFYSLIQYDTLEALTIFFSNYYFFDSSFIIHEFWEIILSEISKKEVSERKKYYSPIIEYIKIEAIKKTNNCDLRIKLYYDIDTLTIKDNFEEKYTDLMNSFFMLLKKNNFIEKEFSVNEFTKDEEICKIFTFICENLANKK